MRRGVLPLKKTIQWKIIHVKRMSSRAILYRQIHSPKIDSSPTHPASPLLRLSTIFDTVPFGEVIVTVLFINFELFEV